MIKVISFDLDGTLMKSNYADLVWLEGLPKIFAKEKHIEFFKAKNFLQKEYDKVGDNKEEWYDLEYWFKRFNLRSDWKHLLKKYSYAIKPYLEVSSVLNRLNNKYNLIIISNAKREFIEIELEKTNLKKYFKKVFSSTSDYHKVKKVSDFYNMICQILNILPIEIVHIGDHKEYDFIVPKKIGINAFYLNRKKKCNNYYYVKDLKEFEEKLKTI